MLVGIFVYLRVASDLSSSLDDGLRTRVDDIARQLQTAGPDDVGLGGAAGGGGRGHPLRGPAARRNRRRLLGGVCSRASVLSSAQLAAARDSTVFFDAGAVPGIENDARLLARPVQTEDGSFVVLAGASTGDRAETLSGLVTAFVIGGPLALLLASALGYALATLAFRPVEEMRRRAGRITLERSGERLPLPASEDEIARLGRTLNEMLARIESSIERERAFVADAGHELRTPLAILRGELELGLRPDRDLEEAHAAMRSAIDEADQLQRLADDLLALARSDAAQLPLELREVAVAELLDRMRARFAGRAELAGRPISVGGEPGADLASRPGEDRGGARQPDRERPSPRRGADRASGRAGGGRARARACATRGRGSRPSSPIGPSTGSAGPRPAGRTRARASAWRSPARSSRPTVGGSKSMGTRAATAPGHGS